MRPVTLAQEFVRDFLGVSASRKTTSLVRDSPVSALIAVATLASYIKTNRDFIVDAFGIPGAFAPTLLALAVLVACVVAISSKKTTHTASGFAQAASETREYSYGIWTRRFARTAFVALLFVIPHNIFDTVEEILPLPLSISGVVLDARTRVPVEGARLRVLAPNEVDVTDSSPGSETDSNGIFVISTKKRVRRSATMSIYRVGCKPAKVALWRKFQTSPPSSLPYLYGSTSPFFSFYIDCQE